jgi:hypothetical protein
LNLIKNASSYFDKTGKLNKTSHPAYTTLTNQKGIKISGISMTNQLAIDEQAIFELKTLVNKSIGTSTLLH